LKRENPLSAGASPAISSMIATDRLYQGRKMPRPAHVTQLPSNIIAIAFVMLSIPGCSTANRVEVTRLSPAQEVLIYQNGRPVVKRAVARGSIEAESVASWLRSHADGWRTDLIDHVPVRRVKGTDFTLDFHPALCILNYQTPEGGWKQVSRPIAPDDPVPDVFGESR
jgi:hypothetical protein